MFVQMVQQGEVPDLIFRCCKCLKLWIRQVDFFIVFNNQMSNKRLLKSDFRYREQDPQYRGDRIDQKYGEGPEEQRGCTDIPCCLLFLAFIAALAYVASIAFNTGNPEYLVYPFDSIGNQCGFTQGYKDYPYIFIGEFGLAPPQPYYVCVRSCPTDSVTPLDCKYDSSMAIASCLDLTPYSTNQIVTYCLPLDAAVKAGDKLVTEILSIGVLQEYFSDIYVAWNLIIQMAGIALVVSIFYSVLIRFFAGCMVWTMIILLLILLFVLGVSTILLSQDNQTIKDIIHYDNLPEPFKDKTYELVVGCICSTFFAIGFLIVCCMRREIKVSIGIIKAAADFVRNCCAAFFIPFYITILQIIFLAFWVVVILFLFSSNSGKVEQLNGSPFGMVVWNAENQKLIIFYIFGLLWVINFFSGLESFWVSSTAAIWYFQSGSPKSPVLRSFCRSFYHLGSIAFGSLLIAIIMLIRIVLEYLNNQLKEKTMGMSEGRAVGCIIKCASCLVACFQRVVRFITENAYIMIAITGKNFCSSAAESFYLMMRSAAQFFISHGTTKLFINLGTALIITICCVIGYFFITNFSPYKYEIQSPVFLTIIFAIVSLPVACAFMEFFEKGANTILMCYCVELDLSKQRSKCPAGLKNFLDDYVQSSTSQV